MTEYFTDRILCYIPYYWVPNNFLTQNKEIKIAFLIYLQAPQTLGALLIFKKYLEPFLTENPLDLQSAAKEALNLAKEAGKKGISFASEKFQSSEQAKLAVNQSLFLKFLKFF
jgi:hypothetical protein